LQEQLGGKIVAFRSGLRDAVREKVGERVTLVDVDRGSFAGRVVADVLLADGTDLAALLPAEGHAQPYAGGAREPWC